MHTLPDKNTINKLLYSNKREEFDSIRSTSYIIINNIIMKTPISGPFVANTLWSCLFAQKLPSSWIWFCIIQVRLTNT